MRPVHQGMLLLALAILAFTATSAREATPEDALSPAVPSVRDCVESRDCSVTIYAIGDWVYFWGSLSPSDFDRLISRGEADVTVVFRHQGTLQLLAQIEEVRFSLQKDDAPAPGVRMKFEFNRGADRLGNLYVAPIGEVFDGHRTYTTKDRYWPKKILGYLAKIVYGP